MDGFKLKNYMNIVDLAVVSYLFDTAILSFFIATPGGWIHPVIFRLLSFIGIFTLIYQSYRAPRPWIGMVRYFYPVVLLAYIYGETAQFNLIFFHQPLDSFLIQLEEWIFGFQPALHFDSQMPQTWFKEWMYFSYFSYYLFTILIPLIAFKYHKDKALKILFTIISAFIIYYGIFIVFPTVGPQFYQAKWIESSHNGFWPQIMFWIQEFGEAPTGAFPSSHVGMMLIYLVLAFKYLKKWVFPTTIFTFFICLATVYVKAHYAVDVIAAFLATPLILWGVHQFEKMCRYILDQ